MCKVLQIFTNEKVGDVTVLGWGTLKSQGQGLKTSRSGL